MKSAHYNSCGLPLLSSERAERSRREAEERKEREQQAREARRRREEQAKLPVATTWRPESVSYEAQLVSHNGALYQAVRDTAQTPGSEDWLCVARAGHAGHDGRPSTIRGTYQVYKKYAQLDVVAFDGASFIARHDDPGLCPRN